VNIRPLGEYLTVQLLPRPERESPILRLERNEGISAGRVLAVGRGCRDVRPGDLVIFPRAHVVIHSSGKRLREALKEEEMFLLKWYDLLFVIEEPGSVEVDGVRWR
jgi:hypothetical protein